MEKANGRKRRLGILALTDPRGKLDDYALQVVAALRPLLDRLVVASRVALSDADQERLAPHDPSYAVSEADGYAAGLRLIGAEALGQWDELVLFDDALMGPVGDPAAVFAEMEGRAVDFWGLTRVLMPMEIPTYKPQPPIPEHLRPHFLVLRRRAMLSGALKRLAEADSVRPERWTLELQSGKCQWDAFVRAPERKPYTSDMALDYPRELVEKYRCPFFLRDCFTRDFADAAASTDDRAAYDLFAYLRDQTDYDVDLIWRYLLRAVHQADFVKNLHLQYVLSDAVGPDQPLRADMRVALVMHLYNEDMAEWMRGYVENLPPFADVYITTGSEKKRQAILASFAGLNCHKLEVRVIVNRGRDVGSIMVGVKDILPAYEYVCYIHDKKTLNVKPASVGECFCEKCMDNTLASRAFVENVLRKFEDEPRLGLLFPTEPMHASYFYTLGNEWGPNYPLTKELADELRLDVPISPDKEPIAPMGSFFWFRVAAMAPLYERKDWRYEDFPAEPVKQEDGTSMHAVERIRPYVVQAAGYYPAYTLTTSYAAIELTNLKHFARGYNRAVMAGGYQNSFYNMRAFAEECMSLQYALLTGTDVTKMNDRSRHIINCFREQFSMKRQTRLWMKSKFPKRLYRAAVKTKRFFFGPRDIPFSYDD